jgi:hypothetical protein
MYQKKGWDRELRRLGDPVKAKGIMVAGFLNTAISASRTPILHILRLLQSVEKVKSDGLPLWKAVAGTNGVQILAESEWPGFQGLHEVNEALKNYRPCLRMVTPTKDAPGLRSQPQHYKYEDQAAYWLVSLAESGSLSFLRECSVCKKWFYAGRSDQKNCDTDCGRRRYRKTEFYRARARLQGKISYWTRKLTNASSPAAKARARDKRTSAKRELETLKGERA